MILKQVTGEAEVKWFSARTLLGPACAGILGACAITNAWNHAHPLVMGLTALGLASAIAGQAAEAILERSKRLACESAVTALAVEAVKWQQRALDIKNAVEEAGVTEEVVRLMKSKVVLEDEKSPKARA